MYNFGANWIPISRLLVGALQWFRVRFGGSFSVVSAGAAGGQQRGAGLRVFLSI